MFENKSGSSSKASNVKATEDKSLNASDLRDLYSIRQPSQVKSNFSKKKEQPIASVLSFSELNYKGDKDSGSESPAGQALGSGDAALY